MIPSNFSYHKAQSVQEAIGLLSQSSDAKLLAGGHSLIPAMKLRLNNPEALVDISKIPELRSISEADGCLVIGAGSTHGEIASSSLIREKFPAVSDVAGLIGDITVRNVGTIGGSIVHADPAADWPAILLAAGAEITAVGPDGSRTIAAVDFFEGFFMTSLAAHEIVTSISIPIPDAYTSASYQKFVQPASRFAIVGCAAIVTKSGNSADKVTVAFTGVSETAFLDEGVSSALTGKELNADNIEAAASKAADGVTVLSDHFASEEYRKHLASVYARKALTAATS